MSKSLEETKKIASDFVAKIYPKDKEAQVVGLYGDLGSGKTTFVKYLAEFLGVKESVQSPTFVIMKIFEINKNNFKHFIHIDAYRLEKAEELEKLGWREIISDPSNLICIEWPERVQEIMPDHIVIRFGHVEAREGDQNQRKISFT